MKIEAVSGDITEQDTDAIVNAANRELMGGGGVDGAIWRAAGPSEMWEACRSLGGCEAGEAKATPGFNLKAKWVIHTVGPVWVHERGGHDKELANCYTSSLRAADELGARSVAFPAISTGVFMFPPELAARVAVQTVASTRTDVEHVRLVAFDAHTLSLYDQYLAAFNEWGKCG